MNTEVKQEQTELIQITETQKLLVGFREKYAESNLPAADTKEGYNFLKSGVAELRDLRGRTEEHRKVLVAPLNQRVKEVNALAKGVIEDLALIEEPMKILKKVEDDRIQEEREKKRLEEEARIRAITQRLHQISNIPLDLLEATPDEIQKKIDDLMMVNPEEDFGEFVSSAIDTVSGTLDKLRSLHTKAVDQAELAEAKRVQEEEERKAQAIQAEKDRIKAEEEEEQRRKDEAELEALRAEKAERERKEVFESKCVDEYDTIPEEAFKVEPPVPADSPQTPLDKRQGTQLEELQMATDFFKEESTDAIAEFIENQLRGNAISASALGKIVFDAIYTGQIPNIKFQIPA